jgi:hypothetical protein
MCCVECNTIFAEDLNIFHPRLQARISSSYMSVGVLHKHFNAAYHAKQRSFLSQEQNKTP